MTTPEPSPAPVDGLSTRSQLEAALDLLAEYIDDEPCWLDHHGYCQNHGLSDTSEGVECRNVRAHRLLGMEPPQAR